MKDIIEQIIEVDTQAFEKKTKNEQNLSNMKREFEQKINSYRNMKLEAAKKNAQQIAEETQAYILEVEKSQKEEIDKISISIEKKYKQSENALLEKIFNKLFVLEG